MAYLVHILNPTLAYVLGLLEEDDELVAAAVERIPVVSVNVLTMAVIVRTSGLGISIRRQIYTHGF